MRGLLAELRAEEALLYFFLCTVADDSGLSFYGDRRICQSLKLLSPDSLDRARRSLEHRGLILYRHPLYQVLALPTEMAPPPQHLQPRRDNDANQSPRSIADILNVHQQAWKRPHQKP
jgi:hypothetical protein